MENQNTVQTQENTKFCKHCGGKIAKEAVICHCVDVKLSKLQIHKVHNLLLLITLTITQVQPLRQRSPMVEYKENLKANG